MTANQIAYQSMLSKERIAAADRDVSQQDLAERIRHNRESESQARRELPTKYLSAIGSTLAGASKLGGIIGKAKVDRTPKITQLSFL